MKIDLFEIIKELNLPAPVGVMQVGASYGQEMSDFINKGIKYGVFVEPLPEPFAHLSSMCKQIPNFVSVQTLCTDKSGKEYEFHVASNGGMSSSILKPARHLQEFDYVNFPTSVKVVSSTVDSVIAFLDENGHAGVTQHIDLLYMDTQGAELKVLLGAHHTLGRIKYIFTEVMRAELYEGQPSLQTMCSYLDAIGFTLNNVYFNTGHTGDALFIRKDLLSF
jgi:FkbM family methyltransferase